jgi:hypothetical protein
VEARGRVAVCRGERSSVRRGSGLASFLQDTTAVHSDCGLPGLLGGCGSGCGSGDVAVVAAVVVAVVITVVVDCTVASIASVVSGVHVGEFEACEQRLLSPVCLQPQLA